MIYIALVKVIILMALITVFFALFCYEAFRPFDWLTGTLTGFFLLIFGVNFVLFAYDQIGHIANGQTGLAWYYLIFMGAICLVFLAPLIYAWRVVRKRRMAKAQ